MEWLPYDCALTRPTAERYTNQQFRRLSRWFYAKHVDQADGIALLVALRLLGGKKAANAAFHWTSKRIWDQVDLVKRKIHPNDVDLAYAEVVGEWTVEHSYALMATMRDGGWRRGPFPPVIRASVLEERKAGKSWGAIAKRLGVSVWQVEHKHGSDAYRKAQKRADAAAALGVG